jgi:hypothetical protein
MSFEYELKQPLNCGCCDHRWVSRLSSVPHLCVRPSVAGAAASPSHGEELLGMTVSGSGAFRHALWRSLIMDLMVKRALMMSRSRGGAV